MEVRLVLDSSSVLYSKIRIVTSHWDPPTLRVLVLLKVESSISDSELFRFQQRFQIVLY